VPGPRGPAGRAGQARGEGPGPARQAQRVQPAAQVVLADTKPLHQDAHRHLGSAVQLAQHLIGDVGPPAAGLPLGAPPPGDTGHRQRHLDPGPAEPERHRDLPDGAALLDVQPPQRVHIDGRVRQQQTGAGEPALNSDLRDAEPASQARDRRALLEQDAQVSVAHRAHPPDPPTAVYPQLGQGGREPCTADLHCSGDLHLRAPLVNQHPADELRVRVLSRHQHCAGRAVVSSRVAAATAP